MQVRAMRLNRPTIPSCLYYDSSNCVSSTLWFFYRRSSKTTSMYACDTFLLNPTTQLQREANSRSVFYQSTFTQNLQDTTLAGHRWSLKRTTDGEQSTEWETWMTQLHFELKKKKRKTPSFVCRVPLCFSLNLHVVLVLGVYLKRCFKKKREKKITTSEPIEFYFFSTTWKLQGFFVPVPEKIPFVSFFFIYM